MQRGRGRRVQGSMKHLVLAALLALAGAQAQAQAATRTALDAYLTSLKTLRAEFSQTVNDGRGEPVQQAQGKLVIVRPGKFRWELTPQNTGNGSGSVADTPQLMISDGKNLWFYDADLEQVSVKPAAAALTATPASLLSGDGNFHDVFRATNAGKRDGLAWVKVVPIGADADFREVQVGFASSGSELRRMVLKDKLGQTVTLDFRTSVRNQPVADGEVSFTPPAGADVIGTPAR
jgi:outer membrane lipoprotein carrier protein